MRKTMKNKKWCNIFGTDIVSYGMQKQWRIKIISKYIGYWTFKAPFFSKIGIVNARECEGLFNGDTAFCDDNGYGYSLFDGALYGPDDKRLAATPTKSNKWAAVRWKNNKYGRKMKANDILVVNLNLTRDNNNDGKSVYDFERELSFHLIRKAKDKTYNVFENFGPAFSIPAFQFYRLAIAMEQPEYLQIIH